MNYIWILLAAAVICYIWSLRVRARWRDQKQPATAAEKTKKPRLQERLFAGFETRGETDVDFAHAFSRVKDMTANADLQIFVATRLNNAKPFNPDVATQILRAFEEQLERYKNPVVIDAKDGWSIQDARALTGLPEDSFTGFYFPDENGSKWFERLAGTDDGILCLFGCASHVNIITYTSKPFFFEDYVPLERVQILKNFRNMATDILQRVADDAFPENFEKAISEVKMLTPINPQSHTSSTDYKYLLPLSDSHYPVAREHDIRSLTLKISAPNAKDIQS